MMLLALQHTSSSSVESKAPPETQSAKPSSSPSPASAKVAVPHFGQRDNDDRVKMSGTGLDEQNGFGTLSLGAAFVRLTIGVLSAWLSTKLQLSVVARKNKAKAVYFM
ncbi:hypothetical protein JB92DRAFT_2828777 [Gautieria morchelliformis]|nr:hypothetical protein JB92DRAFT_2828777 [Gautieria morchelliformis]